jgi:HEAT repeat protein
MTWFVILLLAADPAGRFDSSGRRLEDARDEAQLTPEQEAVFRTIDAWEEMALAARSKQRRAEGAHAIFSAGVRKHKTPLSDAEMLALQTVILKLLEVPEVEIRRDAATTLGRLGFASSAKALRERAVQDDDLFVRGRCYKSLGTLKDEAAIDLLAKAVAKEGPTPAIEAARALAAIGTPAANAALEDLTRQKLPESVLEAVNQALDDLKFGK